MKKIYFYLPSDTLVYLCKPIIEKLNEYNYVKIIIPKYYNENSEHAIKENLPHINYSYFSPSLFLKDAPDAIVFGNDWSAEAKIIIMLCRYLNIVTYAIQESVVDFSGESDKLRQADYIFIQGKQTAKHLIRKNLILSGNPRYENLKPDLINQNNILINCNFTYGVHEDIRDTWINDVVNTCNKLQVSCRISQHPRDTADLSRFNNILISSSAKTIKDQILESSIIITRFSSIIHEALLLGRKVIYYNPHHEELFYDFQPNKKFLILATNLTELEEAVNIATHTKADSKEIITYLQHHVRPFEEAPSSIISNFIEYNESYEKSKGKINTIKVLASYIKTIIKFYFK